MAVSAVFRLFALAGCALAAAACVIPRPEPSGFLGDYGNLRRLEDRPGAYSWRDESVNYAVQYDKIMVDPVLVYFHPDAEAPDIPAGKLEALTENLRAKLILEVQQLFAVVDKPGPSVLRLRTALSNVRPAQPFISVGPAQPLLDAVPTPDTRLPLNLSEAALEFELQDSETGEPIAALVAGRVGRASWTQSGTRWSEARRLFDEWAQFFRERVRDLRAQADEQS